MARITCENNRKTKSERLQFPRIRVRNYASLSNVLPSPRRQHDNTILLFSSVFTEYLQRAVRPFWYATNIALLRCACMCVTPRAGSTCEPSPDRTPPHPHHPPFQLTTQIPSWLVRVFDPFIHAHHTHAHMYIVPYVYGTRRHAHALAHSNLAAAVSSRKYRSPRAVVRSGLAGERWGFVLPQDFANISKIKTVRRILHKN